MGRSEEKKDWFTGKPYTQHYDDSGNKIGTSETKTDWFGTEYVQHYDSDHQSTGHSETKSDWITGEKYEAHYDNDRHEIGHSEHKNDWLTGKPYDQHFDGDGSKIGTSERRTDWMTGKPYTHHSASESLGATERFEAPLVKSDTVDGRIPTSPSNRSMPGWVTVPLMLGFTGIVIYGVFRWLNDINEDSLCRMSRPAIVGSQYWGNTVEVRTGSGAEHRVVDRLAQGTAVCVRIFASNTRGERWVRIRYGGGSKGWVPAASLTHSSHASIETRATPRPTNRAALTPPQGQIQIEESANQSPRQKLEAGRIHQPVPSAQSARNERQVVSNRADRPTPTVEAFRPSNAVTCYLPSLEQAQLSREGCRARGGTMDE